MNKLSLIGMPYLMEAMAEELLEYLAKKEIFDEENEEKRQNICAIMHQNPVLKNPARIIIIILREAVAFPNQPVTEDDIRNLIAEADICAKTMRRIFDQATKEALNAPHLSGKHVGHLYNNLLKPKAPPQHLNTIRAAVRMAQRMGRVGRN